MTLRGRLRGVLLLATFRAEGFGWVEGSVADVLASLAPLLGFPLALGVLLLLSGALRELTVPLAAVAMFLAPLVVSEAVARVLGREAEWGRYAAAYNWCQWPLALGAAAALLGAAILVSLGVPATAAAIVAMLAMSLYQLVLHWFLAWRGLRLSGPRAVLMTLAADGAATVVLVLFMLLGGQPANGSSG
jgi:nitrate reductase gamma subunit